MAKSFKQLQMQIEILQKQADKLRTQRVSGVVSRIKVAIEHYGLTAEQLGFGSASARGGKTTTGKKACVNSAVAKYADGAGRSWSGRGPRPGWLREGLASGKSLQDFASGGAPVSTSITTGVETKPKATSKGKARRKTQIRYRDQGGNTWSGMGPQPRWLKEAIP